MDLHASKGHSEKDVKTRTHDLPAPSDDLEALRTYTPDLAVPEEILKTEVEEGAQKEDDLPSRTSTALLFSLAVFCLYKLFVEDYHEDFYCKSFQGRFYWTCLVNIVKDAVMNYTAMALQPSATEGPEGAGIRVLRFLHRAFGGPFFVLMFSGIAVAPRAFCKL